MKQQTLEEAKQICENCKQTISKYGCACGKQKEQPKQETLEEVARKYTRGVDFGTSNDYNAFIAGANWYKQNYNTWFDYSATRPPIGVEVLAQSDNWINEDYNKKGIRIGFQNEDKNGPFVSAKWDNSGDIYKDCEEYKPTKWKFID